MLPTQFDVHVKEDGASAVDLLANAASLSKGRIKDAMQKGAVWIMRGASQKRLRRVRSQLKAGDRLRIYYNESILAQVCTEPTLIHDAGGYSLWYKPPMVLSSGSRFGDHCAMPRWIETHHRPQKPVFLIHRLDRAASGLMVFGHSKQVAARLSGAFQKREVDKSYRVIVTGKTDNTGTINTALDGKDSISHYQVLDYDEATGNTTLEVKIETGRKHQIRRHLSSIGHPVLGDRLYGDSTAEKMSLVSCQLSFTCPQQDEPVSFSLPHNLLQIGLNIPA
jgi:tRNA pseudouridine32 synthase/23S rRNA pseudouridine746 synthase